MSIEWPTTSNKNIIPKKDPNEVMRLWDSKACAWATGNLVDPKHIDLVNKTVKKLIKNLSPDSKILELASGANNENYYPPQFDFKRLLAVDISPKMIKYLRFKNSTIPAIIADVRAPLPFKDNFFELALSFFSMRYIENQEEVISEFIRVVKPGCQIGIIDYDNIIYGYEARFFNADKHKSIIGSAGYSAYTRRLAKSSQKLNPNLDLLVITKQ
jgi:ubiquinone/menaquinone biosynthesis C-methylase UbiE